MTHFRFAAVGDNCIDRFRPPVGQSLVGGNAVNVAVQLARLGHRSYYFGAVGRDADGARTRLLLEENGVRTEHLQVCPGVTAHTDIDVLASGDRVFVFEDFGVCAGYQPSEGEIAILTTMDHVHIGWMDDGGALRRTLAAADVSVSQDISVNADPANLGVEGLGIAFGSAGDDEAAAHRLAEDLLGRGARLAVVTRGARGSFASNGKITASKGIRSVEVVDTTGAGDSFIAGFLAAHLQGLPLADCLAAGRDLAAFTCGHVGGFPQQPQPL
ncbi:PfkB family carbohydrate kinase [Sinorhizobium numidicum]|uniref:PfkB family carbohydrate kinase n=1 Tax=Sinorhizobium numidicum TaxID=680248 RepID=A0ABY8CNH5_9HYPH|nr:PfkB family carbohydrate kinase [Sinorhizobium numidicum]WEX74226.1 PfkB family carbohydrate kinase [Sinorhizobium numidicum]WEX80211.1 PfkB family carbohydrate kinase [Sinorhizobium numidicum]